MNSTQHNAADLQAMYQELREQQRAAREHKWAIRAAAFSMYGGNTMKIRYRKAFSDGEYFSIPRFDEAAQELTSAYPELTRDGDPAVTLFAILAEPQDLLPSAEQTMRKALEYMESHSRECADYYDDEPF